MLPGLILLTLACNMDLWPLIFNHGDSQNRILFTSYRSVDDQLYTMNPDGTDIQQITSGELLHRDGRWSPDKQKIVCNVVFSAALSYSSMAVLDAFGNHLQNLVDGSQMAWHPSGNEIVFIRSLGREGESVFKSLYSIDILTTKVTRLIPDSLENLSAPCYTTDGNEIYFGSNRHDPSRKYYLDLYKMSTDGSNITRVTTTVDGSSYSPSVSPSGGKVAYITRYGENSGYSLNILDIETNNIHQVASAPDSTIYNFPRWSPDEKHLVFGAVGIGLNHGYTICRINTDGSGLVTLQDMSYLPDW